MAVDALLNAILLMGLGAAALFLGLRLFWLFAAVVGFAVGWWLVGLILQPGWLQLFAGILAGGILALLTRWLGKWAIRIVSALAGAAILPVLLGNLGMLGGISEFIWAVVGAVAGFLLAVFMADWAVIVLSALLGAGLLLSGLDELLRAFRIAPLSEVLHLLLSCVLIVAGVAFQARRRSSVG
jgi:hypothetical protein